MLHYLIELAVWMLGSYFAGACIGCWLKKLFGADAEVSVPAVAAAGAAAAVTGISTRHPPVAPPPPPPAPPMRSTLPPTPTAVPNIPAPPVVSPRIPAAAVNTTPPPAPARTVAPLPPVERPKTDWTMPKPAAEMPSLKAAVPTLTPRAATPTPAPMPLAKDPVKPAASSGKMERPRGIASARGGKADDLQRISGVGPKNERVLHSLGFFHFDQIASWSTSEVEWVDDHLKFNGRIKREEWIRQARLLADGKEAEFKAQYGTGGLKNRKGEQLSGSRTRKR